MQKRLVGVGVLLLAMASGRAQARADVAADFLEPGLVLGTQAHLTPLRAPREVLHAPHAELTYRGGPVISSVNVTTVFWTQAVLYRTEINAFYHDVTQSGYFDWLAEYNTSKHPIKRGRLVRSISTLQPPAGPKVTDAAIQNHLAQLIHGKYLPTNADGNQLFMVHFPPGVQISMPTGEKSCEAFCGYHGTFVLDGVKTYYGVLPDHGGACAAGCGAALAAQLDRTTVTASHELVESVTDAGVGLADQDPSQLGWYDDTYGEIGDICEDSQPVRLGQWAVQRLWSNVEEKCIALAGE